MKVLIACEFSGVVRDAFRKEGHDAWSCDLLTSEGDSEYHLQGVSIHRLEDGWDLMIGHPPCTFMCNSGVCWLGKDESRWGELQKATEFFYSLWNAPIKRIAIENPIPHKYALLPKYTQTIQPYQFGEDASKRTCLWLKNLPPLRPTNVITKKRYSNQTPSGRDNTPPSKDRWKIRSRTFEGIARAMALQWGAAT